MQEENRAVSEFLERTDFLAESLGVSLRQLAPELDISPASLFGYRSGKLPITSKAWAKVKKAEDALRREKQPRERDLFPSGPVKVCDDPGPPYGSRTPTQLDRIESLLQALADHLGVKVEDRE